MIIVFGLNITMIFKLLYFQRRSLAKIQRQMMTEHISLMRENSYEMIWILHTKHIDSQKSEIAKENHSTSSL